MHDISPTPEEMKRRKDERRKLVRRVKQSVRLLRQCGFRGAPEGKEFLDEVGARVWIGNSCVSSHYWIVDVPESVIDVRELDFTTLPEVVEFVFQFALTKGSAMKSRAICRLLNLRGFDECPLV